MIDLSIFLYLMTTPISLFNTYLFYNVCADDLISYGYYIKDNYSQNKPITWKNIASITSFITDLIPIINVVKVYNYIFNIDELVIKKEEKLLKHNKIHIPKSNLIETNIFHTKENTSEEIPKNIEEKTNYSYKNYSNNVLIDTPQLEKSPNKVKIKTRSK